MVTHICNNIDFCVKPECDQTIVSDARWGKSFIRGVL